MDLAKIVFNFLWPFVGSFFFMQLYDDVKESDVMAFICVVIACVCSGFAFFKLYQLLNWAGSYFVVLG